MRVLGMVLAAAALLPAREAVACGGFFCNQNTPVNQAGERILFTTDEQDRLVTYVQVQFTGTASDFSWVVPVRGVPEVEAGTDVMFTALETVTAPRFSLASSCPGGGSRSFGGSSSACGASDIGRAASAEDAGNGGFGGDPAQVLDRGVAGPYEYVVIAGEDADDLFTWLDTNRYTVTPQGRELLGTYVEEGYHLLAVKLLPGRLVGDLRPIVLRSAEPAPCIPLRLTAIAAQPDMPIKAWFLGPKRAVPDVFHHVVINDARIDWPSGGFNYPALVSEAMSAAPGGMGFVTEFAGSTSVVRGTVWPEGGYSLDGLTGTDPQTLMNQLIFELGVPPTSSLLALVQRWQQAGSVNTAQAKLDIEAEVLEPMRRAQAMLDARPYLTRLYTSISPEEMLADPTFAYTDELGDVPAVRTARDLSSCDSSSEDPMELELPSGRTLVYTEGTAGPTAATEAEVGPAAERVERFDVMGVRTIVTDVGPEIPQRLEVGAGGCVGCRSGARSGALWVGTILILLALRRRR